MRRASTGADIVRRRVVVHGRVQGVGFRQATILRARSLGLGGSVCNRRDGAVEAVFEGSRDRVDSMLEWCRDGPRGAEVERIEVAEEAPAGEDDFRVEFAQHPAG